nr:alpha/beta hydrolases superfamily protein [Tanacetum cinerariifolium]
ESEGGSKRHKSSGFSSFNIESEDASINMNTNVGDNDEDKVQEIRRPGARDKARGAGKNKGSKASGSSTMNDDALARLRVTEMTARDKEQREAFLEIKRREVECREGEIAAQEYRQQQDTSLLYAAQDPSIAGMVLDSAFSNLYSLMMELVDVYKIRLPKFTVKVALQYMRRVIQKKAKFDIMDINALKVAPKTFIPALFGHAKVQENFLVNDVSISSLHEPPQLQEKPSGRTECCSYTSSNRESWGRCSSLGSVGEPFPDCTMSNDNDLVTLKAFATPLRTSQHATDVLKEKKIVAKKCGRDKFEKLEALSQRLRLCILKRVKHRRNRSS